MKPNRMATLSLALAAGLALGVVDAARDATVAHAQMAAAIGKPLPSPDLPVGTVTVRVVAGNAGAPVTGVDVTLVVNGTPRVARTDSAGRASFPGLPAGAKVIAKVLDEDKAEKASDEFEIPASGGSRVLLTTKPWQAGGGGGGAPFAGGGAGMPSPRALSGEARGEQGDAPGTLTVRVSYDDLQDTPEGVEVAVIGFAADDSVSYRAVKTDKAGRAVFAELDRSGGTSYFALTQLPRNGAVDRLASMPIVLDAQAGVRMILSSEKRASTAPPIDDLSKADPQGDVPAGKVRVGLEGVADLSSKVTLFDAATRKPIAEQQATAAPPDPSRVQGGAEFAPDAALPAGTLDIQVAGGAGQAEEPLKDVEIRVVPATAKDASGAQASVTSADGTVRLVVQTSEPQKAIFTINGRQLSSQAFDVSKTGGKLAIRARWEDAGRPQAVFDVAGKAGLTVYAECAFRDQHYRSMPFQLLEASGSKITVYAFPRVLFKFQLTGFVEDELFAAQGKFEVMNYSWAPYRGGTDGLVVPMPKGFRGGVVFESDQAEASVATGEGFRIIRPIPPGGRVFHGGFSLPVEHGKVNWSLDLPLGVYESQLAIRKTPGMIVHAPPGVASEDRVAQGQTYALLAPISIAPKRSMQLSLEGLPSSPAWRGWVTRIVALFVVATMLAGVAFALKGKPASEVLSEQQARKQRLLAELIELERTGDDPERREQVLRELEAIWT